MTMTDQGDAPDQPAGDDGTIVIHLLHEAPKEGAQVCICANDACKVAFNPVSAQSGWTTSRKDHASGMFKGKFRSCAKPAAS